MFFKFKVVIESFLFTTLFELFAVNFFRLFICGLLLHFNLNFGLYPYFAAVFTGLLLAFAYNRLLFSQCFFNVDKCKQNGTYNTRYNFKPYEQEGNHI